MKIIKHKTLREYMKRYGREYRSGDLWDFSKEDVRSGAIELRTDQTYWLIKGRYYETLD